MREDENRGDQEMIGQGAGGALLPGLVVRQVAFAALSANLRAIEKETNGIKD